MYVRNPGAAARFAASYPGVYQLSQNRFYFDELYTGIVTLPAAALAKLSAFFDVLVDGLVDLIGLVAAPDRRLVAADAERAGAVLRPGDGARA